VYENKISIIIFLKKNETRQDQMVIFEKKNCITLN